MSIRSEPPAKTKKLFAEEPTRTFPNVVFVSFSAIEELVDVLSIEAGIVLVDSTDKR
jgi:hypothetical protein